jgi:hypothetical protein
MQENDRLIRRFCEKLGIEVPRSGMGEYFQKCLLNYTINSFNR